MKRADFEKALREYETRKLEAMAHYMRLKDSAPVNQAGEVEAGYILDINEGYEEDIKRITEAFWVAILTA